jgi:hypothetical protein
LEKGRAGASRLVEIRARSSSQESPLSPRMERLYIRCVIGLYAFILNNLYQVYRSSLSDIDTQRYVRNCLAGRELMGRVPGGRLFCGPPLP